MIKECNICGSDKVEFVSNEVIYGKVYGNGKAFMCMDCESFVGCHNNGKPYGILANKEMREIRKECHAIFDEIWKSGEMTRSEAYSLLSRKMGISKEKCHFGMFNLFTLRRAKNILEKGIID